MRKEFKAILTDKEEHGDKIEILVREDYAEILTEEDRAYLKGNFKNFTEKDFEKLIGTVRGDFSSEIEAFDTILENFCKSNEIDELAVICENYDTSIFNSEYAREKINFAKTVEIAIFPDTEIEEKLTKINNIFFLENETASAIIEKEKTSVIKPRNKENFCIVDEFEWFVEEVRRLEKLL